MARERSGLQRDETSDIDERTADPVTNTTLLDRRSYLKLTGGVLAAAPVGTVGVAAAEEYETYTLSSGEHRQWHVGDGETFENVLIDATAGGCWPQIVAHGTDWTIRNVGIEGRLGNSNAIFGVSDRGGNTSVIENVYLGDGATDGHRHGLGIWVAPPHNGHLEIRNVNIQEMGDNSFYCSAPGGAGGGTVDIDGCYSANSWVSHFRLAKGRVTDSVAVNDSRHEDGRGVWAWAPGPVEVDGCHLAMNGRHYSLHSRGSQLSVSNTEYDTGYNGGTRQVDGGSIDLVSGNGNDPDDFVPDGCPTSAEEAASGANHEGSEDADDAENGSDYFDRLEVVRKWATRIR